MMTYDEMYHEYKKLQAADEIRNLVSNYCFEHNCALQMRYFHQWSKREDIRHEMPWETPPDIKIWSITIPGMMWSAIRMTRRI